MSPSSPAVPGPPPPPDAPAGSVQEDPRARQPGTALVKLTITANVLFGLFLLPVFVLSGAIRDHAEFNNTEAGGVWFLLWPGLLIVWGLAALGFAVFAALKLVRDAHIAFVLVASLWLVPVCLTIVIFLAAAITGS